MSFIYKPISHIFFTLKLAVPVEPFFSTLAFIFLVLWTWREVRSEKIKLSPADAFWFFFAAIFGSLAGGRVWYYLTNWQGLKTLITLFDIRIPGLSSYGMLLGGFFALILFSNYYDGIQGKKGLFFLGRLTDIVAPGSALFVFIFRMGCLHFGDVVGTVSNLPWSIFPIRYGEFSGVPRHPTAIYLGFSALVIFIFLHWYRERKKYDGELSLWFIFLYSFGVFWINFLRVSEPRYFGLEEGQFVCIVFMAVSLFVIYASYSEMKRNGLKSLEDSRIYFDKHGPLPIAFIKWLISRREANNK